MSCCKLLASCACCVRPLSSVAGGHVNALQITKAPDKERSIQSDNTGADARDLAPSTGCHEVWEAKPK